MRPVKENTVTASTPIRALTINFGLAPRRMKLPCRFIVAKKPSNAAGLWEKPWRWNTLCETGPGFCSTDTRGTHLSSAGMARALAARAFGWTHDGTGDFRQRQDFIHRAETDGLLGHAVDHAGRLVLRDRVGAGVMHLLQSTRAVIAHAGHDNPYRVLSGAPRNRAKQHVHRRTVAIDEGTVDDFDAVFLAAPPEQHVAATRSDQ